MEIKDTNRSTEEADRVSRFHARQVFSILLVFIVLVALFLVMLARQYESAQKHEEEILVNHFVERVAHLENLFARVTEHVEGMRLVAEADLLQTRSNNTFIQPLEYKYLADVIGEDRYHIEIFQPPITQETIGNLTGVGSIKGRGNDFDREIHMALSLNPQFRAVAKSITEIAWVYYTSRNDFLNIFPWVSSEKFKYSRELQTHEFYSLGLPEVNPDRRRYWTEVYVDEYGKGLMTTCAAPVYDADRFLGTVAIDLTVDFLNTVMRTFTQERGVMFLINDRDELLAHPTLISSADKQTKTISEALPEELRSPDVNLIGIPDKTVSRLFTFRIVKTHLNQLPWQVVYLEPAQSFWSSLVESIGLGAIIILTIIFVLIVGVLILTQRQFIIPSKKFVNYILVRSRKIHLQPDTAIPGIWKPWFAVVDKVFSENEMMTQELLKQKDDLEQRVRIRTAELEQEIEERKLIQETLRASEQRFRDISFSMADCIWEVDKFGKYTFISDSVKDILGYSPEELFGKSFYDLLAPENFDHLKSIITHAYDEKKPIIDLENWNISKTGDRICLLTSSVPVFDNNGTLTGYRGVAKNITSNKLAEADKIQLEAQLQRAEKMESLGILAGGVAHDLNNILTGIVTYPDLMLSKMAKDDRLRKPLEIIRETGLKAAAIVQDLLTLARRGVATTEILNLNDIITQYLNSLEHEKLMSFHPNLQVITDLQKDLRNIIGSPIHLLKVVMNLVINAAEAMPTGGTVTISTRNLSLSRPLKNFEEVQQGDYITLSIADTGIGISTTDKERIFEPFYTKKIMGKSGTGLGMSVVWGVVKDHNGYIDLDSTENAGSTFTLYLPVTFKEIVETKVGESGNSITGRGESILVVDDVKEQRDIASMIFAQLGYKVSTASSGEDAIEHVKNSPVDLIILDMIMDPGIDGLDTYKKILEIRPGQKSIIVSGFSETERVQEALRIGAGGFVKKPYTLETIGTAVKKELAF